MRRPGVSNVDPTRVVALAAIAAIVGIQLIFFGLPLGLWPEFALYDGDPTLINSELDELLKITPEQIKNAVNKYLNTDNRALLEVFPTQVG